MLSGKQSPNCRDVCRGENTSKKQSATRSKKLLASENQSKLKSMSFDELQYEVIEAKVVKRLKKYRQTVDPKLRFPSLITEILIVYLEIKIELYNWWLFSCSLLSCTLQFSWFNLRSKRYAFFVGSVAIKF